MNGRHKYSAWILAFVFASGLIVVYKTVDNLQFIFDFFGRVLAAMTPFIAGFVIAYLLNMPISRIDTLLQRANKPFVQKHSKGMSVLMTYVLAFLLLTVLLRLVIPAVYQNVMDLYYSMPYYFDLMVQQLTLWQEKLDINLISFDKQSTVDAIQGFLKNIQFSEFGKYAQGVINGVSGVISSFIAIIISIYMLLDKEHIVQGLHRLMYAVMPKRYVERILYYTSRANDIFAKYIFSMVLDGIVIGVLSTIILSILKVRYAVILGVMIAVSALIPYFGAFISVTLAVIVTLLTGGWVKALWTAVMLLVLQQIDGNFISPKIMGNMLKVRPLLIVFAVTVGGGLFGVWGMLLSVPVAMVLKLLLDDLIEKCEEMNGNKDVQE